MNKVDFGGTLIFFLFFFPLNMSYHKYVVTAQKPTATQFSVKGSFTSSEEINLILG